MARWSFLTPHGRALLMIANDPDGPLLRSIAAELGVTERTAYGVVADLARDGYIIKHKDGRRNRYSIETDRPLPDRLSRERTVGDLLDVLAHIDEP